VPAAELQEVAGRLRAGQGVDLVLEGGGRLHIDRPLPFLCVFRRPGDRAWPDTEALLTSQSAWLIAPASADLSALLCVLAECHRELFGGWLLLEIWTDVPPPEEPPPHAFRIVAPEQRPPAELLEALEAALLRVTLRRRAPGVSVEYRPAVGAPGLAPLLDTDQQTRCGARLVGLGISPVYRDPDSGATYTFAHRALRRRLNRALKQAFHAFALHYTSHRPPHYHALGPRSLTSRVERVDAALADISDGFDLLLHVTPVNGEAAWQAFRRHHYEREVEFLYRPRTIDPAQMKRRLWNIPVDDIEDPTLFDLLAAKRDELDRQITLVSDRNTPRFLAGARQLFGEVDDTLLGLARELLERLPAPEADGEAGHWLDARALARRAEQELAWYRQRDASFATRVEVRDDIAGILVSHGNFLIGTDARVAADRVDAALAHEIGTHALTWHNGHSQPLQELRVGMAGYEPLQEGLAVLAEYLSGGLDAGRLRQLAGRVLAVRLVCDGAGFIEVFRRLHHDHGFGDRAAFMMTMRTFRGGGYVKDAIYLRGLVRLLDHLAGGGRLEALYLGKLAQARLALVEELRWRDILKPPPLLPRVLVQPQAEARRRRLAGGIRVLELLEDGV